jgi:hypothetical protein
MSAPVLWPSADFIKDGFTLYPLRRVSMALQFLARHLTGQPRLPTFDELPSFHNMPGCGWIWGGDDQLGTVNLLSDEVVQRACREEVRCANVILWRETRLLAASVLTAWTPTGSGSRYPLTGSSLELLPSGGLLMID